METFENMKTILIQYWFILSPLSCAKFGNFSFVVGSHLEAGKIVDSLEQLSFARMFILEKKHPTWRRRRRSSSALQECSSWRRSIQLGGGARAHQLSSDGWRLTFISSNFSLCPICLFNCWYGSFLLHWVLAILSCNTVPPGISRLLYSIFFK